MYESVNINSLYDAFLTLMVILISAMNYFGGKNDEPKYTVLNPSKAMYGGIPYYAFGA